MAFGAFSAIESGDVLEAVRLNERARAALAERDWSFYLPMTHGVDALLAWHDGRPGDCAALLREAADRLFAMAARPLAALLLFELAECAAEAGDATAAADAATDLRAVAEPIDLPLYWGIEVSLRARPDVART
jgi:hypothetical protein